MIDHVSIGVSDITSAGEFYDAVLSPLEYERYVDTEEMIGYTTETEESAFFVKSDADPRAPSSGFHIAFSAPNRDSVNEFYHTALAAGAEDDGEPGTRPDYSEHYYAAYVVDPHGYRVEAVTRHPE